MSWMLALLPLLSPVMLVEPIYEEIRLADDLTLRAEYIGVEWPAPHEGMLVTVEDFALIGAELEMRTSVCDSRLKASREQCIDQIGNIMSDCQAQFYELTHKLELATHENSALDAKLDQALLWQSVYKWTSIGLVATLVGTGTYILINR